MTIPKLRQGSYFPDWLLEPRRRVAVVAVVAECSVRGVSTRRVDGLVKTLGIESLSRSQVSRRSWPWMLTSAMPAAVSRWRTAPES